MALFLDFDGTLVEIAAAPDAIDVAPELAARIMTLAASLDGRLALVSGRATVDLERHLGPLSVARAGSHGISRFLADGVALGAAAQPLPTAAVTALTDFAAANGFLRETKPHGIALHFRQKPELEEAGIAFAEAVARENDLQVKRGKSVIEIVRRGADKGGAVRAFMDVQPFAGATPVFIGDDVTDEDGFAAAKQLGGFGVIVGDRPSANARYRMDSVAQVHEWLGL